MIGEESRWRRAEEVTSANDSEEHGSKLHAVRRYLQFRQQGACSSHCSHRTRYLILSKVISQKDMMAFQISSY